MESDYQRILAERRRVELAARKANDAKHRDPELEAAFGAWYVHRLNGGVQKFDEFRAEWIRTRGGQDGR